MHRSFAGRILIAALLVASHTTHILAQYPDRPKLPDPEPIIDAIGVTEGMIIGEAGAGNGYFTFFLAEVVGEEGRIYANDIDPEALNTIEDRCESENVQNIVTVLGEIDDPLFPVNNLDMVVMRYVFHDFTEPVAWMEHVIPYLKPGAPVVIVDMDTNKTDYDSDHPYLSEEELVTIMAETDFSLEKIDHDFLIDNIYFYRLSTPESDTR